MGSKLRATDRKCDGIERRTNMLLCVCVCKNS